MRILQIIIICTAAISKSKCAKDDSDSGKPYEFGFTIDGEQHRYEKRDANGIIQGEFGFITADGIYHVTTYATDENGSFRILSMRNVRISDPLDGSGGTYSNKVPASSVQGAGKVPQKPQQQLPSHQQLQQTSKPTHQSQVSSSTATAPPSSVNQITQTTTRRAPINFTLQSTAPPSSVNQITQTTTRRAPINFTLQSTALPACASCGYVTQATTTRKPVTQFVQSPSEINRPPPNQISQTLLSSSADYSQKTTTRSPFIFSSTTTQTFNVDNSYKPGLFAPSQQQQHRRVQSVPQTHPLPVSQSPSSPDGPPQTPQSENTPSQILTLEPSHSSIPGKPPLPLPVEPSQFKPETPSQFVEPPAFSPQQPQIQSNVDTFNPASESPLSPITQPSGPPQSFQQLNIPSQISFSEPLQSLSPEKPILPSPIGPSQLTPETPSQFVQPPAFNPHQPQTQPNIDTFNPASESVPLLPTASIPELPPIQNDKIQLPVNTFARPPINTQPEFDKKTPNGVKVENGMIYVRDNPPIKIQDKYPGMVDGLPEGIEQKDIVDLLYKFNYTIGFHGHYEKGWRNGTKIGGYFVNGRDGISRVVTYVADENGYRPKFRLINLGLESPDTPKEDTEKTFGLKSFEFVWYPLK